MKIKIISLLLAAVLCLSFVACSDEAKRPVDYPDTTWTCNAAGITFTVSENGEIKDATAVNKNGETVEISLVFSDISEKKVSITSADGSETYLSGSCTYGKDKFTITISDIFNTDFSNIPVMITFES